MLFGEANFVQRLLRQLGGRRAMARLFARTLHRLDLPVMRLTGGRRSVTEALTGLPVVQLTTTGARTGLSRTMPIVAVPDGDRLVLVASNYGSEHSPGWYFNLKANPRCTVVKGGTVHEMEAFEAEGQERERLWALDSSAYPARRRYAGWAGGRRIPVMVLQPIDL